jgi:hypothetical protein
VHNTDFALDKGLFADGFKSEHYKSSGHPGKSDFLEFAKRVGAAQSRADKLLNPFLEKQLLMETLVSRSFLSDTNKRAYMQLYSTKRNYLLA